MLEYNMDITPDSYSNVVTPDAFMKSFPFYVTCCGKFVTGEKYYTKRDGISQYTYLLIVTTDGCGRMYWHGQKCTLPPGSAVLIDCRSFQEYSTMPGCGWHFYYLHFHGHHMGGYQNSLLDTLAPVQLRVPEEAYRVMEEIYFRSFDNNLVSCAAQSNAISNLLTEMLYSLIDDKNKKTDLNRSDIMHLAEYIKENCTKDLHIHDFTAIVRLTQNHLIRLFKKQTGLSPYQYLHMCRINKSQRLLLETDLSIAKIAELVGYNESVTFIRHFKSFNQITPSEYREMSTVFFKKQF